MRFTEVETLLATRLGFDIHTIGPSVVEPLVKQSMEEAGCSDPAAYVRLLAADSDAWDRLIDRVVIPETWFFRDLAPFELAANLIRAHTRRSPDRVLRVLSCPCSTGEEPYSLVMAMLNAGAQPESFAVDGVDVCGRALEFAQNGVFRARSFRENDLAYRTPYFSPAEREGLWRLSASIAPLVRFRRGNMISPDFLQGEVPYDVVFCRNLLIYLHSEARLLAMAALRRLIAENGVLVLGHAEAAFARQHGFRPTGPPAAFAFIKKDSAQIAPKERPASRQNVPSSVSPRPPSVLSSPAPTAPTARPSNGLAALPRNPEVSLLMIARQLGDAGQLDEALRACTEHLQRVPDSAEGHFLLGVLHDALGHLELAVGSFRKVLYLDPAHREALLHLALKQEARGDGSGAALLRARARRAEDLSTSE